MLDFISKSWNYFTNLPIYLRIVSGIVIIFIFIAGILLYFYSDAIYKFFNKDKFIFYLETKQDKTKLLTSEFKIHDTTCSDKSIEDENTITVICDKPKKGQYQIHVNDYKQDISITDDLNHMRLNIDKNDFILKTKSLSLDKNKNIEGEFSIKNKNTGVHKYPDEKDKIEFTINGSNTVGKILNGNLLFSKKWNTFSNVYYGNKKLGIEYKIDDKKYYSYKPYFLTNNLDISEMISLGKTNNNQTEQKINVRDYIKIKNNRLQIYKIDSSTNINLFTFAAENQSDLNGYIKFSINNIHKDTKINLYLEKKQLFNFSFPYYKFDIKNGIDDDVKERIIEGNLSYIQYPVTPNEKNEKFKNNTIEKIDIEFYKKDNNCSISATTIGYKPAKTTFTCNDIKLKDNEIKLINFQLNIESAYCKNKASKCVLFEISDIETANSYDQCSNNCYF